MRDDILDQLRIDPGQRTLGQLMQDREHAAHEIARLRSQVERLEGQFKRPTPRPISEQRLPTSVEIPTAFRPGSLVRLSDVCEFLGISRSTVYLRLSEGRFPPPVRLGPKTVRWRIEAVEDWRDSHISFSG